MEKTEAIYKDLITKLSEISTAAEYETGKHYESDLGADVRDWDQLPVLPDDSSTVRIEDKLYEYEQGDEYRDVHPVTLNVNIRIICKPGSGQVAELRKRHRDILRCIGSNKSFFQTKYPDAVFSPVSLEKMIVVGDKYYTGALLQLEIKTNTEPWLIGTEEF